MRSKTNISPAGTGWTSESENLTQMWREIYYYAQGQVKKQNTTPDENKTDSLEQQPA